jgi:LysR family transcriptional regulator, transcriptional activator for bauABCD operon
MSKSDLTIDLSVVFARNVDWNLFKIFYEIARRGGIGAAARALNKQQPSVSAALQRLEQHVGATLCTRTSRGVELTIQGHQLLAACKAMYTSVQNMPRAASAARGDISGSVALRVISNLHLLPQLTHVFDEFHRRYPRIDIKLDVSPWREVLRSLKNGEVELGIGFADELDKQHLYIPIADQTQQIYCGPKHGFFGRAPISPTLMEDEPFVITQDEPTPYVRYRDRYCLGRHIGGYADNLHERMWLIQLGMGIGILPKPIVEASTFASVLWPLLSDADALVCPIYLMANAEPARSAPAQLFLDVALEHLQSGRISPTAPSRAPAQAQPVASDRVSA